jgi:hypothetical protein
MCSWSREERQSPMCKCGVLGETINGWQEQQYSLIQHRLTVGHFVMLRHPLSIPLLCATIHLAAMSCFVELCCSCGCLCCRTDNLQVYFSP